MDILLIIYSIILVGILALPFIYIRFTNANLLPQISEVQSSLNSERKMLLENLKDLKIEMDTGKIHSSEFSELSLDIIATLKSVDEKLKSVADQIPETRAGICSKCKFFNSIVNAKFCAMCGNSLSSVH